MLFAFFGAGL